MSPSSAWTAPPDRNSGSKAMAGSRRMTESVWCGRGRTLTQGRRPGTLRPLRRSGRVEALAGLRPLREFADASEQRRQTVAARRRRVAAEADGVDEVRLRRLDVGGAMAAAVDAQHQG